MAATEREHTLEHASPFECRQAVERLRDGLFDPLAVRLLTTRTQPLHKTIQHTWQTFARQQPTSLFVCGAYGQGKSHHLTYIQEQALQQGFVTSFINLDPREIPFQQFRQVYQALLMACQFPGHERSFVQHWQQWVKQQKFAADTSLETLLRQHAPPLPHLLSCLLVGLAQPTVRLSAEQRAQPKHQAYRPQEFALWLEQALLAHPIPLANVRTALNYRQVGFYRQAPLTCSKPQHWLAMLQGIAHIIRLMGYAGWVLLLDEGESIAQLRLPARRQSYQLLHSLLQPEQFQPLLPVLAFTDHFFQTLEAEDYQRPQTSTPTTDTANPEPALPYFAHDYAAAWEKLPRYLLQDLTQAEWNAVITQLILLYHRAYQTPEANSTALATLTHALQQTVAHSAGLETRFRLKALIQELDCYWQELAPV